MRQGELRGLQFEEDGQGRQKEVRDGAKGLSGEILCDPPSGGSSRKKKQNKTWTQCMVFAPWLFL